MAENVNTATILPRLPEEQREKIVGGMRWTVWAAAVTAPLTYVVSVLLGRLGPGIIGIYGLTGIYSWFASTFLFLGGGAVVVRFMPSLPSRKRLSFLVTYLGVILALALPWQVLATIRPSLLTYVFGSGGSRSVQVLLLWLAPVYVFYLLVDSALASLLEIRYQQLIRRMISVVAFGLYASVFFLERQFLTRHASAVIWSVYLVVPFGAAVLGARRLIQVCGNSFGRGSFSRFLPEGFWKYTFGVQADSMLGLFTGLTGILTVRLGGVSEFGLLVVLNSLGFLISRPVSLIMSVFLPSLTNSMESVDPQKAGTDLVKVWSRLMLAGTLCACAAVCCLSGVLIRMFGREYMTLVPMVSAVCVSVSIDELSGLVSSIFYAVSRPYANVAARIARLVSILGFFWPLWERYRLWGVVIAGLIGSVTQAGVLVSIALIIRVKLTESLWMTAVPYWVSLGLILLVSRSPGWFTAKIVGYGLCAFLFLLAARYSVSELLDLIRLVLPASVNRKAQELL